MTEEISTEKRLRIWLKNTLPQGIVTLIVKLKGGGAFKEPKIKESIDENSLNAVIAYNKHGAFCVPRSCLYDTPVQSIFRGKQYESETIDYIASLELEGDIIHAGAYFGDTIPALSNAVKDSFQIWAFEPNKESYRCAEITLLLNDIKHVSLFNCALGENIGKKKLLIFDGKRKKLHGGTRYIVGDAELGPKDEFEEVEVKTLDSVVDTNRNVALLFLDVEGFEEHVLKGARRILKNKPLVIVEINNEEVFKIMDRLGYELVKKLEKREWRDGYRNGVFKPK